MVMGLFFRSQGQSPYRIHPQKFRSLESFNHDGFEIARRRPSRRGFPWQQVLYFAVAVVAFKIFLFFEMGGGAYGAKIEALKDGTTLEQVAAVAMTLDPVSQYVVDAIRFGRF